MKTIIKYLIPAAAALVMTASCSDFLDDQPEATSPIKNTDYTKLDNVFKPVSAAYASMRGGPHEFPYIVLFEISSDNADKGSEADDNPEAMEIDEFAYGPSNTLINTAWDAYYGVVSAANFAIAEMPKFVAQLAKPADRQYAMECQGEAKFIRAYAYFNLVRLFGNIPLVDERTYTADEINSLMQAPRSETYDFIINDLWDAINILPEEYTPAKDWAGRITKYSAMGLLAKVYLYKPNYDSVAYYTDQLIKTERFALMPTFRSVFRSEGQNGPESLFEIQASTIGRITGPAPFMQYAYQQGPRGNKPSNMQGWGFCVPSNNLISFFDDRGDDVRAEVVLMKKGTIYEGDSVCVSCPNPYYNGKVFSPSSENTWSYNGYGFDYNVRILRYADILLMHAEALVRGAATPISSGMTADAAMNLVRDRADLSTPGGYSLQDIKDERRAELCMEEDRFFDLVRTGDAATVLGPLGFTAGKNELYPIPTKQRQTNLNLEQNPKYTK